MRLRPIVGGAVIVAFPPKRVRFGAVCVSSEKLLKMLRSATFVCVIAVFVGILGEIKVSLFQVVLRAAPEHKETGAFCDMR